MEKYFVPKIDTPLKGVVTVPGSKSMTNRALLLATLSEEESVLRGVLFSDDSRHFLACLQSLGFLLEIDENEKVVKIKGTGGRIPYKTGTIDVGSAGTAARFLTAMLALSDGEYTVMCSEQMEKRPMAELFNVLTEMGARFEYLKNEGHLPAKVIGNGGVCKDITMDISRSTQFLSAMLMVTPVTRSGIRIRITSEKKTGTYIEITMDMLREFGINVTFDGEEYIVDGNQKAVIGDYYIEPDVSAACYFYAMTPLLGIPVCVEHVHFESLQGDVEFLHILEKMGCSAQETENGVLLLPPAGQTDTGTQVPAFHGITVDMSSCSDQAITLAAIAPFADSPTCITGIGHIRFQESDRIHAICTELTRMGIHCEETQDSITIYPGMPHPCTVATYDDHRMAMGFALTGLRAEGIVIDDPGCCRKTFENYFEVLDQVIAKIIEM